MGKAKGGGKKAFLKGVHKQEELDEEAALPAPDPVSTGNEEPVEPAPHQQSSPNPQPCQPALKQKPSAPPPEEPDSPESGALETRGQVLQRHKRELKALKDKAKKLGKAKKDEVAKQEAAMERRHAAELQEVELRENGPPVVVTVTESLYDMKLQPGGEDKGTKQLSKAQKRKEKLQQEEAAREARIAEEQAALGDSERVVEERQLRALLQPLGLAPALIQADGHCMYRALAHQLRSTSDGQAGEGAQPDEYQPLRAKAAAHLRQHADQFLPFIIQDLDEGEGGDVAGRFERHCEAVEHTAAWGGQAELSALADALQRHVVVYSAGMPPVEMGAEHKGKGETLRLCYLRHAFGLGEHYNSVEPLQADDGDAGTT